jgi:hypothetical protein
MDLKYNYPSNRICNLIPHTKAEGDTIQTMLVLVIGDHPTQCKPSKLKQSGKYACRRCKIQFILLNCRDILGQNCNNYQYLYDQNLRIYNRLQKRSSRELFENLCM